VVVGSELNAAAIGGLNHNGLFASLDGDGDDSHGLGSNGSEDEEGGGELHCEEGGVRVEVCVGRGSVT